MRATSVGSTTADLAILRLRLELFVARRCRRLAFVRMILPVPVILKRLATALRVLLRAIGFGIGKVRKNIKAGFSRNQKIPKNRHRHFLRVARGRNSGMHTFLRLGKISTRTRWRRVL